MYKLTNSNIVIRTADGASIPKDLRNMDYLEFLTWCNTNTPEPADPLVAPAAPATLDPITKLQELLTQHPELKVAQPEITPTQQIDLDLQAKLKLGVVFNGNKYHTDPAFQVQLTAFVTAFDSNILQAAATVTIRDMNNSLHQHNYNSIKNLAATVLVYVQTCYAESWAAKDALASQG